MWRKGSEIVGIGAAGTKLKSEEVIVSYVKCKYEKRRNV